MIQKIRNVPELSNDFSFYQAEYDDEQQRIVVREKKYLSLNKVDRKQQIREQVMGIGES